MNVFQIDIYVLFYNLFWSNMVAGKKWYEIYIFFIWSFYNCKLVSHRNYNLLLGISLKDVVEYIRKAVDITYEGNGIPVFIQKSVTEK